MLFVTQKLPESLLLLISFHICWSSKAPQSSSFSTSFLPMISTHFAAQYFEPSLKACSSGSTTTSRSLLCVSKPFTAEPKNSKRVEAPKQLRMALSRRPRLSSSRCWQPASGASASARGLQEVVAAALLQGGQTGLDAAEGGQGGFHAEPHGRHGDR